ncbi:unnamed protein product [Miscanthus lutarioriparius]|uniref:Uncharacterized protein n=1 Tax=Miscanthus lutarioriparius TaxID=422564 RepID=A0A811PWT4_9POAL|nr:unnamed protein product [Miscanthus lutarioriparius]
MASTAEHGGGVGDGEGRRWEGLRRSAKKAGTCMLAKSTIKLETDSCGEQWLMAQVCGQDGDLFLWREQRLVARSSRSPA